MKVRFYVDYDKSDVYEFEDDLTEDELLEEAADWVDNNASFGWEIVDEDDG